MKNKKILTILLVLIILLTSGCGAKDYIHDKDGKMVTNNKTGQTLQSQIFCKPSNGTDVYKLYEEYSDQMVIPLDELPECSNFKIKYTKTDGIWSFIFVKPIAWLILRLGNLLKAAGLKKAFLGVSLIIIGVLIRLIMLPLNIKTQNQSKNIQKLQPEIARIERKYAGRNDQEAMIAKSQETMLLYRKYKINPLLSCVLALIQLPLFFAFLQAIYKIPTIYEGSIFGWNLGTTPSVGFANHHYSYIILVILIIATTFFSFKMTMNQTASTNTDAQQQTKVMLIVMTAFIGFASLSLPTAIALYWISTYAVVIAQTYIMKAISNRGNDTNRSLKEETKRIREKLKIKEGMKYGKDN